MARIGPPKKGRSVDFEADLAGRKAGHGGVLNAKLEPGGEPELASSVDRISGSRFNPQPAPPPPKNLLGPFVWGGREENLAGRGITTKIFITSKRQLFVRFNRYCAVNREIGL